MRTSGDSLLLIEGNGKLDKVTIKGDEAQIETIKDGFAEPVSVTQVGDTAWVAGASCLTSSATTRRRIRAPSPSSLFRCRVGSNANSFVTTKRGPAARV